MPSSFVVGVTITIKYYWIKLRLISVGSFYVPTRYANNTVLGLLLKVMVFIFNFYVELFVYIKKKLYLCTKIVTYITVMLVAIT